MIEQDDGDLVWRLRHPLWQHYNNDPAQLEKDATQTDLSQAADEIERLRGALLAFVKAYEKHDYTDANDDLRMAYSLAEVALTSSFR